MQKPSAEELELLHKELCSAINDTTRIAILYELADGPRNVSSIVEHLDLPQGTVSRHLKILRERGIVTATREANRVLYALQDRRVLDVLNMLRGMLAELLRRQEETADRIRQASGGRP
jgi:ArsR family transcriptional regulator